jgi:hypothetical protein
VCMIADAVFTGSVEDLPDAEQALESVEAR